MMVRWRDDRIKSGPLSIVRQGGYVVSPSVSVYYMDELSNRLSRRTIGCLVAHLAILFPYSAEFQHLFKE